MPTRHHIHRLVFAGALAVALLASAMSGAAFAQAGADMRFADAPTAQEIARAQERYYATTGRTPQVVVPKAAPQSAAVSSDDTPWLFIGLSAAAALALVTASGGARRA